MVLEKKFGPHFLFHKYESFKYFVSYAPCAYKIPMKAFNLVFVRIHFLPKTREASNSVQDIQYIQVYGRQLVKKMRNFPDNYHHHIE